MPERPPSNDLPETVWIASRWYLRHDGWEHVETILSDRSMVAGYIDYGYEVRQYVRTAAQPFRRRPLTEREASEAGEWFRPAWRCTCVQATDSVRACAIHGEPSHGGGHAAVNL